MRWRTETPFGRLRCVPPVFILFVVYCSRGEECRLGMTQRFIFQPNNRWSEKISVVGIYSLADKSSFARQRDKAVPGLSGNGTVGGEEPSGRRLLAAWNLVGRMAASHTPLSAPL